MAKRMSDQRRAKLLWELAKGEREATEIAAEFKLSMDHLIYWVNLPENWHAMEALSRLHRAQTRMALDRQGLHAAWRLGHLATRDDIKKEHDVSRRACMDLLKARHPVDEPAPMDDDETIEPAAIVRAIEEAQRGVCRRGMNNPTL